MPYKILTVSIELGPTAPLDLGCLFGHLAEMVRQHMAEGWEPIGGHTVTKHNKPHGVEVVAAQSVKRKPELTLEPPRNGFVELPVEQRPSSPAPPPKKSK